MLKAVDDVVMEQEDSASRHGEMTSWDINDIKLPQVCACVLEMYPVLTSHLHFTADLKCFVSYLCLIAFILFVTSRYGTVFYWKARKYWADIEISMHFSLNVLLEELLTHEK